MSNQEDSDKAIDAEEVGAQFHSAIERIRAKLSEPAAAQKPPPGQNGEKFEP
jgi:hypothetical protein